MKFETFMQALALFTIGLGILAYAGVTIYQSTQPAKEITFNVVGISNESMNTTTKLNLHFECFKYCIDHNREYSGPTQGCWEECYKMFGCEVKNG